MYINGSGEGFDGEFCYGCWYGGYIRWGRSLGKGKVGFRFGREENRM